MIKRTFIFSFLFFQMGLIFGFAQDNNTLYYLIFNKNMEQYRWNKCSELLYFYASSNNIGIEKLKNIINVLSSDEEKINNNLRDYWKQYWSTKSTDALSLAQKEATRTNQYRANQLTFDAKFAQRLADDVDERKVTNITIEKILNNKLKLQGNPIDVTKENVLQGFRKYYSVDYEELYEELWKPNDEKVPESYSLSPYLFYSYKVPGPSIDMIHSYRVQTHSYFDFDINIIPFSIMLRGENLDYFNGGYGISFKPRLNFSTGLPLYDVDHLFFSHNSFKEILDINERNDLQRLYYQSDFFWDIVTNAGFIFYPSKYDNSFYQNYFISQGLGVNYRLDDKIKFTFNLYYLSFIYLTTSTTISPSAGTWYYFVSPEIEADLDFDFLTIKPSIQFTYQFKENNRVAALNFGLGFRFSFGEERRFNF